MALMTYTILVSSKGVDGSIKNDVNRSDIPAAVIVDEAEAWLWEEGGLRVREMIATEVVTFSTTSNEEDFPADGLDPIQYLPYQWAQPLKYVSPELLKVTRDSSGDPYHGDPTKWALVGTVMTIDTIPADPVSGVLMYYARPTALGVANTTNFVTTRYPALFRHICRGHAFRHMKDYQRAGEELQIAAGMVERIKQRADLYLRSADLDEY